MSPYYKPNVASWVTIFIVYTDGSLYNYNVPDAGGGIRPVINLSSDVKLTGSGTTTNPYKIVE